MSGSGQRNRKKRARLFELQGGICFWCKLPMRLLDTTGQNLSHQPKDMCTLDHLEPRWHPERGTHAGNYRLVAACFKCNNTRDQELHRLIPRELLHRASAGERPIHLAAANASRLAPLFPASNLPKRRTICFTFEPKPVFSAAVTPLRVPLAESANATRR